MHQQPDGASDLGHGSVPDDSATVPPELLAKVREILHARKADGTLRWQPQSTTGMFLAELAEQMGWGPEAAAQSRNDAVEALRVCIPELCRPAAEASALQTSHPWFEVAADGLSAAHGWVANAPCEDRCKARVWKTEGLPVYA